MVDQTDWICDAGFGGVALANRCPYFELKTDVDTLKRQFQSKFSGGVSLGDIARDYPDVVALMWVLETGTEEPSQTNADQHTSNLALFMNSLLLEDGDEVNHDE